MPQEQPGSIDVEIGNRIRIRRVQSGMSLEQLGDLLGLTFRQIQKYERGVNRIGAGRLYEFGQILNVPVSFFYEGLAGALPLDTNETGVSMPPVMEFVSSGEGYQLVVALMKIKDAKVRKRMLDLVKVLAPQDE